MIKWNTIIRASIYLTFFFGLSAFSLSEGFYENDKGSPLFDLINGAKKTLDIEIYEMNDPKVIDAVYGALDRNVYVRVVKEPEPVGGTCRVFEERNPLIKKGTDNCEDQKQLVIDVRDAGGEYVPFNKTELCNKNRNACLEHGKLVIADSKLALISTGNFNTTSLCDTKISSDTCNRDYSYITNDEEVIEAFEKVVDLDIEGNTYDIELISTEHLEKKATIGPDSLGPLIAFIQTAKKSIKIQNQYLKQPEINNALIQASKNGIEIEVVVASACAFGKPKPNEVKKLTTLFNSFENAGITISMFTKNIKVGGKKGYMHAKAIVIDEKNAWLGSVNGSTQAATINREFGIFFEGKKDVSALIQRFDDDFNHPESETWQESLECAENGP